jgi:hypothetical protein
MFKLPKADGTEGTATITFTFETNTGEKHETLVGCFVDNNENLKYFIRNSKKSSHDMRKFESNKYYFYGPYFELKEQIVKAVIHFSCFSDKKNEKKTYKLDINEQLINVLVDKSHLFFLCESEELNKCSFLENNKKNLRVNQRLSEQVFALGQEEEKLMFISIKINKCESHHNMYEIKDTEAFEKLKHAGPILLEDNQTLVGCFTKKDNCRISISIFGKEGNAIFFTVFFVAIASNIVVPIYKQYCDVNLPTINTIALAKLPCFISQLIFVWHIDNKNLRHTNYCYSCVFMLALQHNLCK